MELNPFSYVVLALVGREGAGAHDLVRMMRAQGGLYWAASESHWYSEPKRLERLGYLRSRKVAGQTTPRTKYELTAAGRSAVQTWLKEPSTLPRIQNEAVVRLLASDLGKDADVLASLTELEPEIAAGRERVAAALERASGLPHRERYLKLVHRLGELQLAAYEQWLDEVRAELS
jgi:DNA-binding PadR family transcriptional regulator